VGMDSGGLIILSRWTAREKKASASSDGDGITRRGYAIKTEMEEKELAGARKGEGLLGAACGNGKRETGWEYERSDGEEAAKAP